jgi:hypothetical protein
MGNAGKNGPVIVPLKKTSDNVWSEPPGAKLQHRRLIARHEKASTSWPFLRYS